jgi:hypothetical protein
MILYKLTQTAKEFFMQAEEDYHERIWGDYPNLDQLLSRNQPSMRWHGPTSLSRNIFNQNRDLLHVYALVSDQVEEITQLSHKAEYDNLRRELGVLSDHLNWMSDYFKDASKLVQNIYGH